MTIEFDIIKEVVKRLDETDIPYMITGSIATNFYSISRMTRDIDIVIELKESDVEGVYNAFEKDFYIDKDMVFDAVKRVGMGDDLPDSFKQKVAEKLKNKGVILESVK